MVIIVEYLIFVKQSMNRNYIKFIYITLYFIIILYYIILHLPFILLLIYNLSKGSNGKVKLEMSRLWQLDNSWRKTCERG